MIHRLARWLLRVEIDDLQRAVTALSNAAGVAAGDIARWQREHQEQINAAWTAGMAVGEQQGMRKALDEVYAAIQRRTGVEAAEAQVVDVEEAASRLIH